MTYSSLKQLFLLLFVMLLLPAAAYAHGSTDTCSGLQLYPVYSRSGNVLTVDYYAGGTATISNLSEFSVKAVYPYGKITGQSAAVGSSIIPNSCSTIIGSRIPYSNDLEAIPIELSCSGTSSFTLQTTGVPIVRATFSLNSAGGTLNYKDPTFALNNATKQTNCSVIDLGYTW